MKPLAAAAKLAANTADGATLEEEDDSRALSDMAEA
jgi:hypothetical protein